MFKSLNIGTSYSRKLTDTTVGELKLTKQEIKDNPYATLGYIELDIYNKHNEDLEITAIEYLYKQNGKVINTETSNFVKTIHSNTLSLFKVPFKFLGNGIRTTIILKTNIGNITINDPDTLFSVIKK